MRRLFLASVFVAAFAAVPAAPTTFASLTTIYVGSGVVEEEGLTPDHTSSIFQCSNVSGVTASVRFLVLDNGGSVAAAGTTTVVHGAIVTAATEGDSMDTGVFEDIDLSTGLVAGGVVNIESTQSAVFCNAYARPLGGAFVPIPLVRVNAHPGAAG